MSKANTRAITEALAEADLGHEMASRSFWKDARIRFFRNRAATVSIWIMMLILAFGLFGGFFAQWSNEEIDWGVLGKVKELGGPSIASGHYFGVDDLGRDLYARMVQATRVSLSVAFISGFASVFLGSLTGALAGYYGGRTDRFLLGAYEIWIAIPYIIFFVVWQAFFGRSMFQLLFVLVLVNWYVGFLIVRGQVQTLKTKEYIDAARLIGLSDWKIITRHLLPNMLGIIVINASLVIPEIILAESLVSFLGVGIQEPATSWGALLSEGARTMQFGTLWQFLFPALFFMLAQIALYYIGDGMRDAFDPKDR